MASPEYICTRCHSRAYGQNTVSQLIVLGRWVSGVGLLMSAFAYEGVLRGILGVLILTAGRGIAPRCEACGSIGLVPTTTPRGQELAASSREEQTTNKSDTTTPSSP
jgi:hypothetical protein